MTLTHINPDGLASSPAFSQVVVIDQPTKLIQVGGQNGIDADGNLVGNDLRSQSVQALKNVLTALEGAGASQKDVVRLGIFLVHGNDVNEGYAAAQEVWGPHPTTITVLEVAGLGNNPAVLVEIEALAVISGDS